MIEAVSSTPGIGNPMRLKAKFDVPYRDLTDADIEEAFVELEMIAETEMRVARSRFEADHPTVNWSKAERCVARYVINWHAQFFELLICIPAAKSQLATPVTEALSNAGWRVDDRVRLRFIGVKKS